MEFLNKADSYDPLKEFEKINIRLMCARSEFNNATDPLMIKASIFRLNELEARRDIIIRAVRGERR